MLAGGNVSMPQDAAGPTLTEMVNEAQACAVRIRVNFIDLSSRISGPVPEPDNEAACPPAGLAARLSVLHSSLESIEKDMQRLVELL